MGLAESSTMSNASINRRFFIPLVLIDMGIVVVGSLSWLMNLQVHSFSGTLGLCASMALVHGLSWLVPMAYLLQPLRVWERLRGASSDAVLLAADVGADRLPLRLALIWSASWLLYYAGLAGLSWFGFPEIFSFGRLELMAMVFQLLALALGPPVLMVPLAGFLLHDTQFALGAEFSRRKLLHSRMRASMLPRSAFAIVALLVGTVSWFSAAGLIALGESAREASLTHCSERVRWSAHLLADGETQLEEGLELRAFAALPPELSESSEADPEGIRRGFDLRTERASAAAPVGDGQWVIAVETVALDQDKYWIGQGAALLVTIFTTVIMIVVTSRMLSLPLQQLHAGLRRMSEIGDLGKFEGLPVMRKDEIGELTAEFNGVLETFAILAAAARAVAKGDLSVKIEGDGDLQEAFRSMVARLAELVMEIRDAAMEVASAAAEIHAATVGQEEAASKQSDESRDVSAAMQELAGAALDISSTADEVLNNAVQTRSRSDLAVARIVELGDHITSVGELLEQIREVADRSDLLALNGSLEATRAGEAGRGFALVANEMRRLAERVTGTVGDVRGTLIDISRANQVAVVAVEDSRALAELTMGAARKIADVTATQGEQSLSVSLGAAGITELVASSAAASTQIRVAASSLRERAAELERLIEHFGSVSKAKRAVPLDEPPRS